MTINVTSFFGTVAAVLGVVAVVSGAYLIFKAKEKESDKKLRDENVETLRSELADERGARIAQKERHDQAMEEVNKEVSDLKAKVELLANGIFARELAKPVGKELIKVFTEAGVLKQ